MWETGPQTFSDIQTVKVTMRNLQNKYPRLWRLAIFIDDDPPIVSFKLHAIFLKLNHGSTWHIPYVFVTTKEKVFKKYTRKVSVAA